MVGPWDEPGIEFLDNDRVTSPQIRSVLWNLFFWRLAVHEPKWYLVNNNLVGSPTLLPGYLDFVKRCYFHVRDIGRDAAIALVQSDVELFKSWNFRGDILQGLALLQGVRIQS